MRFGIGLQWADWRHMTAPAILNEVARNAARLGFDSLWTTDRLVARSGPPESSEALITLASLIHVAPSLQLGVAVMVLPLRSAVIVAKQAATLSVLSGGRLVLGIGAGWNEREFKLLGTDHRTRGKRMNESIEVMQALWRQEKASYKGRFYDFEHVTLSPRPEASHVPLWIGGNSLAAIRRAATMGDGWLPSSPTPESLREGIRQLEALAGDRPTPTVGATLFVDASLMGSKVGAEPPQVAGSIAEMVQTLKAYETAGLAHLIINFVAYDLAALSDQMALFATEVMPHFPDR